MKLTVTEKGESFQVLSPAGKVLAYVYFDDGDQMSKLSARMRKAQAQRFAENIANTPGILDGVRQAK